jgi:soluble lytic murein transglycosylase-like protein
MSKKDLLDVDKNIKAGYYVLMKYRQQHGSFRKALEMYYGSVDKEENRDYALRVLNTSKRIAEELGNV